MFRDPTPCDALSSPRSRAAHDRSRSAAKKTDRGIVSRTFKSALLCLCLPIVLAAAAWAQQALKLKIDGKSAASAPLMVQGKTYIALDALKAAGVHVQVNGSTIELTLPSRQTSEGGANQQGALEGKAGDWLFNGIWRFRVVSIVKADPDNGGAGWRVKVEIRNGSKFNGYAPSGTGWQGITLVTEDGASIPAESDAVDLRDMGLAQGAGNTQTLFFATESTSSPIRIILRFDPKGLQGTPAGLRYTTPDPSFRIDIKNSVKPN